MKVTELTQLRARLKEADEVIAEMLSAFGDNEKWSAFTSGGGIFDEEGGDFVYAWNGDKPLDHVLRARAYQQKWNPPE